MQHHAGRVINCTACDGLAHSFSIVDDLWDVELLIHCRGYEVEKVEKKRGDYE
jgi:hypothetical protein